MSDLGYRSIEIHVVNNTHADLAVQAANTMGANCAFISGEVPVHGDLLRQFQDVVWGVMTKDLTGDAGAYVSLTGLGDGSIEIDFRNPWTGVSVVTVGANSKVADKDHGTGRLVSAQDPNHSIYRVLLHPTSHLQAPGK